MILRRFQMDKDAGELAALLPFRIVKLIQYGRERDTRWELVLDDGRIIDAGTTINLLYMRLRLRARLYEKGLMVSPKAAKAWRDDPSSILDSVEREHRSRSEYRRKYGR